MSPESGVQRRDFLKARAAVAASTAIAPALFADTPKSESHGWLRKTLKYGMIKVKGTMTEKFQVAKDAGFEGVELSAPGLNVNEAKQAAKATGIIIDGTVGGYHWAVRHTDPKPEVRADALARLKKGIADTAAVGGESMLLVPGHGKDGTDEEVYQRAVDAIKSALPVAEKHKVAILIENVWNDFCYDHEGGSDQTADRLAAFIDEFKSPWVGVQFDIGNHWKYGDPAEWIRTLGSRIQKLDIKGYSREKQAWAKITEGDIDWPAVEKALRDIKFTGWLAAEVGGGNLERLKEVSDHLEAACTAARVLRVSAEQDHNSASASCHVSVMPDEVVGWLSENSPKVVVDGTYGGGGHSRLLLNCLPQSEGHLIGLDRDPAVSQRTESELLDPRLTVFLASYEQVSKALAALELDCVDAMVLDLGLSSDQLADRRAGFSFTQDGPLDLRFDPENGMAASQWLARHNETEIADAIYQYGEERYSRRIARSVITQAHEKQPVKTVAELVEICRRCVPRSKNHDIHPATRTFQALRIAVNDELGILERTLRAAPDWFSPGGRFAVISFHSLEDRIVKNAFRDDDRWTVLTKKPLRPTAEEVARNPRSRSAKMRVAERNTE